MYFKISNFDILTPSNFFLEHLKTKVKFVPSGLIVNSKKGAHMISDKALPGQMSGERRS